LDTLVFGLAGMAGLAGTSGGFFFPGDFNLLTLAAAC